MKRKGYLITVFVGLALALGVVSGARAQSGGPVSQEGMGVQAALGTGFTYQGQLKSSGSPVNGSCTLGFGLWDASSGGAQLGVTQTVTTTVTNGLFTVTLNDAVQFGGSAFSGSNARYLGIGVKCGSESTLTNLGRQALTAAPYALYARNNWGLNGNSGTSASNFLGTTGNMTLTLAVSNTAALRLVPNTQSPNLIGGYSGNTVSPGVQGATIAGGGTTGGYTNTVSGNYGTVGGGAANTASGTYYATVGGGVSNTASGYAATVSGGNSNLASGNYSFAAGQHARAIHNGAFVWADDSSATPISSTVDNQFLVRASGGITLYTNLLANIGAVLAAGSGTWSSVSDRNLKANFAPVDGVAILNQLNLIPIQTWNYQAQDVSIRHIGPMAQDFYAVFNVGEDNTHITTVDADGVALAAIQGLYQVVQAKDAQMENQQQQIEKQQQQITDLQTRVSQLEKNGLPPLAPGTGLPLGRLLFGSLLLLNLGFMVGRGWGLKKG